MESLRFLLTSSFYPPYHIGGADIHVCYPAQELVKRGHEVHVMHRETVVERFDWTVKSNRAALLYEEVLAS
jgi:hypothetical protein